MANLDHENRGQRVKVGVDSRKEAIWGEEVQMLMVQVSVEYTSRGIGYRIR